MKEGRKGGREEGRKGGREEGRKGGREEGRKGGREEGRKREGGLGCTLSLLAFISIFLVEIREGISSSLLMSICLFHLHITNKRGRREEKRRAEEEKVR